MPAHLNDDGEAALDPNDAQSQLKKLEDRLDRIERVLGLALPESADAPQPKPEDEVAALSTHRVDEQQDDSGAPEHRSESSDSTPTEASGFDRVPSSEVDRPDESPIVPPPIPASRPITTRIPSHRRAKPPAKKRPIEWENLIGKQLFRAVGALLVVVAIGLFLKYVHELGWLSMSAAWKCIWGAGFGLCLLVVGEIVRRRINALASAGFTAAGLGTMYASTYAAYGRFELLGAATAFVLLAACAGIGIVLSARAKLASVAILSLLGGYLVLFLLYQDDPSPWVTPAYLLMLLGVGLALSGWLRETFVAVRTVVWWATVLIGAAWIVSIANADTYAFGAVFVALVWAMVHGELFAAARGSSGTYEPIRLSEPHRWNRVRAVAVSFSTTAWCAGFGALLFYSSQAIPNWMAPMAGVAATLVGWNLMASHLRVLRETPTSDAERLGAGLAMQAGGLLFAAISLGLSGQAEVVLWFALGVGAVLSGRWLVARSLHVYGLISLVIGTLRLLLFDSLFIATSNQSIAGFVPNLWMLLAVIGGGSWLVASWSLLSATGFWARLRNVEIGLGLTVIFLAFFHQNASMYSLSLLSLVFAIGSLSVARWRQSIGLSAYALGCLAVATGWIIGPMYFAYRTPNFESLGFALSWWNFLMFTAAAAWAMCRQLVAGLREKWWGEVRHAMLGVVIVVVFGAWFDQASAPISVCLVWLILSHGLGFGSRRVSSPVLDAFAPLGVLASLGMWTYGFVMSDWGYSGAPAVLHPGLLLSFVIAVSFPVLIAPLARNTHIADESRTAIKKVAYGLAVVLVLVSTSFEAGRIGQMVSSEPMSQRAILTIWWGVFGFGLIVAGFKLRLPPVRYAGLALIVIATGKAISFDLTETEGLWRVASIILPGLIMLVVGAGYAQASAALARTDLNDEDSEEESTKSD